MIIYLTLCLCIRFVLFRSLTAFGPRPLRSSGPWILAASVLDNSRSSAALVIGVLRRSRSDRSPSARTPSSRPPLLGPLHLRYLGLLCSGPLWLGPPRIGPPSNRTLRPLRSSRSGPRSLWSSVALLSVPGRFGRSGARPARLSSPRLLQSWDAPILGCSGHPMLHFLAPLQLHHRRVDALTPHRRSACFVLVLHA